MRSIPPEKETSRVLESLRGGQGQVRTPPLDTLSPGKTLEETVVMLTWRGDMWRKFHCPAALSISIET